MFVLDKAAIIRIHPNTAARSSAALIEILFCCSDFLRGNGKANCYYYCHSHWKMCPCAQHTVLSLCFYSSWLLLLLLLRTFDFECSLLLSYCHPYSPNCGCEPSPPPPPLSLSFPFPVYLSYEGGPRIFSWWGPGHLDFPIFVALHSRHTPRPAGSCFPACLFLCCCCLRWPLCSLYEVGCFWSI